MEYTLESRLDGDILRLVITGRVTTKEAARELVERIIRAIAEAGVVRVLFDVRGVTERLDLGDTFFHVREAPRLASPLRKAVLEAPEHAGYARFFQTTAGNAGLDVKTFFAEDAALGWLRGDADLTEAAN